MRPVKIKRQLHKSDLALLKHKIGALEDHLKNLHKKLNEPNLNLDEINQIFFGLHHGMYDVIKRSKDAIDSVGKEMD